MARSIPRQLAGWRRQAYVLAGTLWVRAMLTLLVAYVAILPVGQLVAGQQELAAAASVRERQVDQVQSDVQRLRSGVVQESAALRGYLQTGDPALLGGFDAGSALATAAWSSLAADARSTSLEAGVPPLRAATDAWQGWAAERRRAVGAGGAAAPADAGLGAGEGLLNDFQAAAARLVGLVSAQSAGVDAEAASLRQRALVAGTIGPIVGPALLLVLGSAWLWLALRPVRSLARAANRLAAGLEPEIRYLNRRDELGAVARALARWRRSAATQRLIWQHSPIAMLVFGVDMVLRQVNPADMALFRENPSRVKDPEYMAGTIKTVTHPDSAEATARMYRRLLSGRSQTERLEKRYIRGDGSVFWGNCILSLVRDAEGQPDHYVCMIEDISERRGTLERAARVQRDLLPESAPDLPGYDLAGLCRPSREIGGDFYDWSLRASGSLVLTLGDVMGKDMPAALLMATVCVALRTSVALPSVEAALGSVAASIERDLGRAGAFVTLFHGRLDPATGLVSYVDAGHGLALVAGEGGTRVLQRRGSLPLGVLEGERYEASSERLGPGEALVVFSDGVLDVHTRLEGHLEAAGDLLAGAGSAREMAERLASGPGTPADDVTVVVLRRLPAGGV
jgi:PAS domain S-box-containing protein